MLERFVSPFRCCLGLAHCACERVVRVRINQRFFRAAVLAAYEYKCYVTGLMCLDHSFVVRYRPEPKRQTRNEALDWLLGFEGKPIALPQKFRPDPALLVAHEGAIHSPS